MSRLGRGRRVEVLWALFVGLNFAVIIVWPRWDEFRFHFGWISLTVLYGFRVWAVRPTLVVLGAMMAMTAGTIALDGDRGLQLWGQLLEVPLLAGMFLAMVWHARRRVQALRVAELRAEQGRSLLERQERFIHDASHELRTPVTIARGHLELLRAQTKDAGELDVALDELERMEGIVERLLLLADADQPNFVRREEIELEPFLEDVFMRWSELAPRVWRLGALAPGRLLADSERVRTALDALIENAVKYTEPGAEIELRSRVDGNDLLIEVRDAGCGVTPDALDRIFERFGRAEAARTRAAGGVGLGLAIADAIAKAHDGRCLVTSTAAGSIFALRLPHFTAATRSSSDPDDLPHASALAGA